MPETNLIDKGQLRISAVSAEGNVPIDDATIEISSTGEPEQILEQIATETAATVIPSNWMLRRWNTVLNRVILSPIRNII